MPNPNQNPTLFGEEPKKRNNLLAITKLSENAELFALPVGKHDRIKQKALLTLEDVEVSVRPEYVTWDHAKKTFSLTKFRFSKSKVSDDASETGTVLLLEYAKDAKFGGYTLDFENTRLIDVFSGNIVYAHRVERHRLLQLQASLKQIACVWPGLKPHLNRFS